MSKACLCIIFPVLLLLAGCATVKDNLFVIRKLDDPVKAKALTEQGIREYNLTLVRRQDFDRLPEVKKYFTVALRYDPLNPQARQYLTLVEDFRLMGVREKLEQANAFLARENRGEEEEYGLQVALQTAVRLDPSNEEVVRLLRETAQARAALVGVYLGRSRELIARSGSEGMTDSREALTIDAYRSARRAAEVDPRRGDTRELRDSLLLDLSRIVDRRIASIDELTGSGRFEEAAGRLAVLADLNRTLGGPFEKKLRAAGYALNFRWAEDLFERKEYRQAEKRVDAALSLDRTAEAAALRQKLDEQAAASVAPAPAAKRPPAAHRAPAAQRAPGAEPAAPPEARPAFDERLREIDRSIVEGDLVGARRRIDALARAATETAGLAALDSRRAKLRSLLKDLYNRAVTAYREERFREAIDLLQTVVQVDASYELAADYLEKAKTKQEVLDLY